MAGCMAIVVGPILLGILTFLGLSLLSTLLGVSLQNFARCSAKGTANRPRQGEPPGRQERRGKPAMGLPLRFFDSLPLFVLFPGVQGVLAVPIAFLRLSWI
jgi:hypothetical protein